MMSKGETIAAIMKINRSVSAEFLSEFSSEELTGYLDRLGCHNDGSHAKSGPTSPGATALRNASHLIRSEAQTRSLAET